jgi:hypothetical protein
MMVPTMMQTQSKSVSTRLGKLGGAGFESGAGFTMARCFIEIQ